MPRRQSKSTPAMRRLLAIDAVRALVLGGGVCVLAWYPGSIHGVHPRDGWLPLIIFGLVNIVFAFLLGSAVRSNRTQQLCTAAAIINGLIAGMLILLVSLFPAMSHGLGGITLLVAVMYGAFALLEWRQVT